MQILCLGDSITDCGRSWEAPPLGNGYVKIIADEQKGQGKTCQIANRGIDGFTVARLLDAFPQMQLPFAPDITTLLIGINDIALMMNTGRTTAQQQKMQEKFLENYEALLRMLPGRVILMEPFIFPKPEEYLTWLPHLQTMSDGIDALAEKYRLPYVRLHKLLNRSAREQGMDKITIDGVHLTKRGHRILADALLPCLAEG